MSDGKYVFNLDLNTVSKQLLVMSVAREFQTVGAAQLTESTIGEVGSGERLVQ